MSENGDLIREARAYVELHGGIGKTSDLIARLAAALEARPSLAVRGEEELAQGLHNLEHDIEPVALSVHAENYRRMARALIANGTVQVVPSLVAPSLDELNDFIIEQRDQWPRRPDDMPSELLAAAVINRFGPSLVAAAREALIETMRGLESAVGFPTYDECADALLAGPVQLADATPEQAWDWGWNEGWASHAQYPDAISDNPYNGFTRKERNDGE